jgi:hypothetical protein
MTGFLDEKQMARSSLEELQAELQALRDLVVSQSATLLRTVATHSNKDCRASTSDDAERLMHEAEECFRCARLPSLKTEIAEGLNVAGQELMAKAVKIETEVQRAKQRK